MCKPRRRTDLMSTPSALPYGNNILFRYFLSTSTNDCIAGEWRLSLTACPASGTAVPLCTDLTSFVSGRLYLVRSESCGTTSFTSFLSSMRRTNQNQLALWYLMPCNEQLLLQLPGAFTSILFQRHGLFSRWRNRVPCPLFLVRIDTCHSVGG
jgi:hypothetical protein